MISFQKTGVDFCKAVQRCHCRCNVTSRRLQYYVRMAAVLHPDVGEKYCPRNRSGNSVSFLARLRDRVHRRLLPWTPYRSRVYPFHALSVCRLILHKVRRHALHLPGCVSQKHNSRLVRSLTGIQGTAQNPLAKKASVVPSLSPGYSLLQNM
jgi:hypothetical protein